MTAIESDGGVRVSPAPCASFATSRRRERRTSDGSSPWGHDFNGAAAGGWAAD